MAAPAPLVDPLAVDNPCIASDDFQENYSLRIAALFAILGASTIGGLLPLLTRSANLSASFFLGAVFASGVVLATGFVHILPDAANAMSDPCLGFSTEYPWAFVFAGAAALVTFVIEYFLKQYIRSRLGLPPDSDVLHHHAPMDDTDITAAAVEEGGDPKEAMLQARHAENKVAAIMLEAGVIFHSMFIGIDVGINSDPAIVRPLMIALMFHQGFEGLALGTTFIRAQYSTLKYLLLMLLFVLITPIGIAIGLGVGASYNSSGQVALGFEGAFNSVSAGILIYNGIVDLLLPTFAESTVLVGNRIMQLVAMFFLFAGYACMSLLAKWA